MRGMCIQRTRNVSGTARVGSRCVSIKLIGRVRMDPLLNFRSMAEEHLAAILDGVVLGVKVCLVVWFPGNEQGETVLVQSREDLQEAIEVLKRSKFRMGS